MGISFHWMRWPLHCQRDTDLVLKVAVGERALTLPGGRAGTGRPPGGQGALGRFSRCVPATRRDAIQGRRRRGLDCAGSATTSPGPWDP